MSGPFAFIPSPAEDPLAGRGGSDSPLHHLRGFLFGGGVLDVQAEGILSQRHQVRVRIDESRQQRGSVKIERPVRIGEEPFYIAVSPHPEYALAFDGDGLGQRLFLVHGHDPGVS